MREKERERKEREKERKKERKKRALFLLSPRKRRRISKT